MTSRSVYVTIKIMREACVKLCLLLEILITVKNMNILHYYCDIGPRTNVCTTFYSCDICTFFDEKWGEIDEMSEIERDLGARENAFGSIGGWGV